MADKAITNLESIMTEIHFCRKHDEYYSLACSSCSVAASLREGKKRERDNFLLGVLVALAEIYSAGEDTTAEEIVSQVGSGGLLRVATKEDDITLPKLKKTIRFLSSQRTEVTKSLERSKKTA